MIALRRQVLLRANYMIVVLLDKLTIVTSQERGFNHSALCLAERATRARRVQYSRQVGTVKSVWAKGRC